MTDLAATISGAAKKLVRGTKKLVNSDNVDSQIGRSDLTHAPSAEPSWDESKLISLAERRYREARLARLVINEQIVTGLALYRGDHYSYYNAQTGTMEPIDSQASDLKERFAFKRANICRVMAERVLARLTASFPDAWAAPLTSSPEDKQAAQVARSVTAHTARATCREEIIRQLALMSILTTTNFVECSWDPKAEADVGLRQADGSVTYKRARVGDVRNTLLLPIDLYPDPNCYMSPKGLDGAAYIIKREIRSVDYIEEKWGVAVEPSLAEPSYASLLTRLEMNATGLPQEANLSRNSAEITSCLELPSPQYTDGRYWVVCGTQMLHAGPWPYTKRDSYPYAAFSFAANPGCIWGLNLMDILRDTQMSLNTLNSYLAGRTAWDRPVQMVPDNAGIAPADLLDQHFGKVIRYKAPQFGGAQPTWTFPPPPGPFYFQEHQRLIQLAEYLAGVHDIQGNEGAPPNLSGAAYDLLMQEDKSRLGPVIERLAGVVVKLQEWDIALMAQFGASAERMLGLDDKSMPSGPGGIDPAEAGQAGLVDVAALQRGQCRVVLSKGSGEAKLPAALEERLDQVMVIIKDLPAPLAEFYLSQLQSIRSDAQVDRLLEGMRALDAQRAAQAPNPMGVAALKAQAEQQQMQAEQQQAQLQLQAQTQAEVAKAQIDAHTQGQIEAIKLDAQMRMAQVTFSHALSLAEAQSQMQKAPTIAIAVKTGPTATASAEEKAGLEPDSESDLKTIMQPPAQDGPAGASPKAPKAKGN